MNIYILYICIYCPEGVLCSEASMCCINLDDCSAGTYIRMYVRRYVLADVYSMYLFLFMYVHNMYVRTCIHLYVCHIVGNIWGGWKICSFCDWKGNHEICNIYSQNLVTMHAHTCGSLHCMLCGSEKFAKESRRQSLSNVLCPY